MDFHNAIGGTLFWLAISPSGLFFRDSRLGNLGLIFEKLLDEIFISIFDNINLEILGCFNNRIFVNG